MVDSFHEMMLHDEDILRYALDDERLPTQAEAHLAQCADCQQRLARYVRLNAALLTRLYRTQCPDSARLGHYCSDLLPADDAVQITAHLQQCPLCSNEATAMRHLLAAALTED